jgi:hypothetical protein
LWSEAYAGASYGSGYGNITAGSRTGAAAWAQGGVSDPYAPDDDDDYSEDLERMIDLVRRYPAEIADLLEQMGVTTDDLLEIVPTSELGVAMGGWHND